MSEAAEFKLIARHFRPLAGEGALGLLDDAALLTPPAGQQLRMQGRQLMRRTVPQGLLQRGLLLHEQPLAEEDLYGHVLLSQACETPICMDESIHSVASADSAIEFGACSIINMEVYGQTRQVPYVYAEIVLDGASTRMIHMIDIDDLESAKKNIDAAKPNMPMAATFRRPQLLDLAPQ